MTHVRNIGKRKSAFGDRFVSDTERIIAGKSVNDYSINDGGSWRTGKIGKLDFSQDNYPLFDDKRAGAEKWEDGYISLCNIEVNPEYGRRGAGTAMMKKLERIAQKRGIRTIITIDTNTKPETLGLLNKMGYVERVDLSPDGKSYKDRNDYCMPVYFSKHVF